MGDVTKDIVSYQNGVPEQYFALEMWQGYIANVVAGQFQQHLSSENIFINSKKKRKKRKNQYIQTEATNAR